jgi:hypothetical protein
MSSKGRATLSKQGNAGLSLKEQARQQMMDLLRVAEKSSHPEIRTAAIEMAKNTLRHEQKQTARLSPTVVLWLLVALFAATVSACWYAFLREPNIAYQLSGISILLFIVISAIVLFVSGTLSQTNLMKVLDWAKSMVKRLLSSRGKDAGEA